MCFAITVTPICFQVDFYLPQLINMYIMMHAVAEVIHPYLIARCDNDAYNFANINVKI